MAVIETWIKGERTRAVQVQYLQGNLFSADNDGNLVGVEMYDGGEPASLAGSVSANVIRADGTTVAVTGTLSDGYRTSVVLPQACYAVPGVISIIIKITDSDTDAVTTLGAVVSSVYRSTTDTVVDPGDIIPSVQTLIAAIETAVGSIPADYSSLWTSLAPAYSTSSTYAVGAYVTYNGGLYRCITAITAGESWTSGHWTAAKLGPDLSNLKSAIAISDRATAKFTGCRIAQWENGVLITIPSAGSTATYTRTARNAGCLACVMDVEPGEVLYYSGTGGTTSTGVAYGFTDASDKVISRSSSNYSGETYARVPGGAKKVILNQVSTAVNPYAYVGKPLTKTDEDQQEYIDQLNGEQEINLTAFSSTVNINGATAEYDSGKLKLYGTPSGTRYFCCLNGQKIVTSGGDFDQTLHAGVYRVHYKVYGNVPNGQLVLPIYTTTTFNDSTTYLYDGYIIKSSSPIMVGLYVPIHDYGTSENPTYIEFSITEYTNKANFRLPTFKDITKLLTGGVLTAGTYTLKGYTDQDSPIMLKMQSMYSETNSSGKPTVQFEARTKSGGRMYFSHKYSIESDQEYKYQAWRIPNNFTTYFVNIIITVPEGSTLAVKSFDCKYVPYVSFNDPQIIFHAHRGLEKFWPSDTFNAVVAAAEMGFKSCIMIPKFTSDGVAVCFHNDGGSSSPLNAYLTMPDGSAVPELEDTSKKISDFTYAELMQWSMGAVKAQAYADEKILTMDDFLMICAETGMRPIYSIHPTLTADQWAALKVLLDKYNLASKLSVKDGDSITWTRVVNAFGDGGIYSIISLSSSAIDQVTKINNWKTAQGITKTRVDAEWMSFDPNNATYVTRTQEAKAAGIVVSAVLSNEDTGDYIKACMSNGITEFTNCRHCSMGLNW